MKTKTIPISAAKKIAKDYGYEQIVIIGRKTGPNGNGLESVATYGVNKAHCGVAANIGNYIKYEIMKWEKTKKDNK